MIDSEESKKDAEQFGRVVHDVVSLLFRTGYQGGDFDEAAEAARDTALLAMISIEDDAGIAPLDFLVKHTIVHAIVNAVRAVDLEHTTRLRWSDSLDCVTCERSEACTDLAEEMMQAAFAAAPEVPKRYVVAALLGVQAALRVARREREERLRAAEDRELQRLRAREATTV